MERRVGEENYFSGDNSTRRNKNTARSRLRDLDTSTENLCQFTLEQIGERIGVTRQRVEQLMPDFAQRRQTFLHQQLLRRLQDFLEERPEAILTKARGGMYMYEIAENIGVPASKLPKLWQEVELPDRKLLTKSAAEKNHEAYVKNREHHLELVRKWHRDNPEKVKAMGKKATKKYLDKVLRVEHCEHCGDEFNWTQKKEKSKKQGGLRYQTCGQRCSTLLGIEKGDREPYFPFRLITGHIQS